jgi:transcriptional regulator with XRE-family HTH domain
MCKSSTVCAWRETVAIRRAQDKPMEQGHHIGWAIKQVIEARGISQLRLAEICDKDPATITRWLKHGKTIGSEYVKTIADFLGMKVSDLYKIAEEGIFRPVTAEDERKARLKAMIDGLDPSQLSILFPENPADPQRHTTHKAA